MKITKYKDQIDGVRRITAYFKRKEFDKEGNLIHLGNGSKKGEPEYHKTIRSLFNDMDLYRSDEEEMEDFLSYLMDEVEIGEGDRGFNMPLPDSTTEYFVIFNDKIWLYLYFADEYMGMGDSSQYVRLQNIVVSEGADIEEIMEVKNWLVKGGFKMLR